MITGRAGWWGRLRRVAARLSGRAGRRPKAPARRGGEGPTRDVDAARDTGPARDTGAAPVPPTDAGPGPGDVERRAQTTSTAAPRGREVDIPHGVLVASEWSWRLLLILAAAGVTGYLLLQISIIVVPVLIAALVTALIVPVTDCLHRSGLPRGVAAGLTLLGLIIVVLGLLALVGQQVATGYQGLYRQVVDGIDQVRIWLIRGPLKLSEAEIDNAFQSLGELVTTNQLTEGALRVSTTVGHVVGGLFLALFTTYFMLYDGERIWRFLVGFFPRSARVLADSSGRRGWVSLTAFVRATVIVAFVDGVGIMIVALVLGLPFAVPIGVLVFLASFVPIIGALVSGAVAVLVALVAKGPFVALIMLGGVLLVQQLEAHVLQPFLLGRFVRLHPVAILLGIGAGAYLAGIAGALFAVPLVAVLNGIVRHLAQERTTAETRQMPAPPPG
ncbi:AI-2E family transporter [Actinopolymorpha sp. B17G11]|uniref:AI-2E family transporter n=1 Tax=Actinopolymorpha sp. B17G11 TaxID=3160861 RepID=UPI0032E3EDDB